jgi:hypothetical protein
MSPTHLPDHVARLLWDVDPSALRLDRPGDRDLVFERVMTRGTLDAMRWLRATWTREVIAAFVREKGRARLTPRDLAYWALVSGVAIQQEPGGGRPAWAGP